MSVTATVVKVTATLLKDKNGRKILKVVLGIVLGIVVLIAGVFFTIGSALSNGAGAVFDWIFSGNKVVMDASDPAAQAALENIQFSFTRLDAETALINERLGEEKVDALWVKSVFYTLYFEKAQPADDFYPLFAKCFVAVVITDEVETQQPQTNDDALSIALSELCQVQIDKTTLDQARTVFWKARELNE